MTYRPRHRHAPEARAVKAAVVVLAAGLGIGGIALLVRSSGQAEATRERASPPPRSLTSPASPTASRAAVPFVRARGLTLLLPSEKIRCVCFHEASYGDAQVLRPSGRLWHNYNRTKFTLSNAERAGRPRYLIMASRGRSTGATTAADLVMPRNTRLVSPISGVVTKAKSYHLYGAYQDWRIEIRPDGVERERVLLIHLDKVAVRPGDRVEALVTVLGVPRVLPFTSETDNYIAGHLPHVHVEITLGRGGPGADA